MTDKTEAAIYALLEKYVTNDAAVEVVNRLKEVIKKESFDSKVEEFHKTFNQHIAEKPSFPNRDIRTLRLNLILEELTELAEAMGIESLGDFQRMLFKKSQIVHEKCETLREKLKPNLVAALDALCDIQYVLSGTNVTLGMQNLTENAFNETHRSNMTKACDSQEDVEATIEKYKKEGVSSTQEHHNGAAIVLRFPDRKLLKSINYSPANFSQFIINDTEDNR